MPFWEILQDICFVLLTLFGLCYAYQLLYVLLPLLFGKKWDADTAVSPTMRGIAILIAARNEENVLPHLLDTIANQKLPLPEDETGFTMDDVYVVADNCTDATADAAARSGATVYRRQDTTKIGKGYALDWLLGQMRRDGKCARYDGFLVLDADNLLSQDYLTKMHQVFAQTDAYGKPKYGIVTGYRNAKNFGQNWLTSGYGLWFLHDSGHLNRSRHQLGLTCTLSGTGFCIRRSLLDTWGGWPFHTLTEDLECTADLATGGLRFTKDMPKIGYCHDAVLYDEQPSSFRLSIRQRIRWAQGGIQVSLRYGQAYLRGLCGLVGLRKKLSCLENCTLSLWGYGTMTVVSLLNLCCSAMLQKPHEFAITLLGTVIGFFVTGWALAIATVATEGRRIHGTKGEVVRGILTFPLFLASFAVSVALALVTPRQWRPIRHTEAVSLDKVLEKTT